MSNQFDRVGIKDWANMAECSGWLFLLLLHLDVKNRNVIGPNGLTWHAIIIAVSFGIYVPGEHTIYVPREHSIYVPREHNI